MKTYTELLISYNGLSGSRPNLDTALNELAKEGWQFETLIPVPGQYVCVLLSKDHVPKLDKTALTPSIAALPQTAVDTKPKTHTGTLRK